MKLNKSVLVAAIGLAAFVSAPVLAVQQNVWQLNGIQDGKKQNIAVVLQTVASGKVGTEKTASSLRFICTGKEQIVGMRWQGNVNAPTVRSEIYLDGRKFDSSYQWNVQDKLLHRNYQHATTLVNKMLTSNEMSVKFTARGKTWTSSYNLKGLNAQMGKFKQACRM